MKAPMFSIIVVSLNAGEKLTETIESIRKQTFTDYEVVVKDGGSKDGSVDALRTLLEQYDEDMKKRIRIFEERDSSIYDGMNQAVAKAEGEYLYFLNCGDYFYNEACLEQVAGHIEACRKNSRDGKKEGAPKIFYGDIYDALRGNVVASNPKMDGFACYRNVPCHQACLYDRELFAKRGYEPKYRVRADYEHFLYSFYKENAKPAYIPVVLASYEGGGFSETAENRKKSAAEHKEITALYMSKAELFKYRAILALTLAPLRTKMAESPKMSRFYSRVKSFIYGGRN